MIASSPFDELRPEAPPLPVIDALLSLLVPVSLVLAGIAAVLLVLGLVPRIHASVRSWFLRTAALAFAIAVVLGALLLVLAL